MHPRQKEIVWTPELAYSVGLITTDGCLSSDGRHIDFTSKDLDLVETFKKCLGLTNSIGVKHNGRGQNSFRIQFGDVAFYRWLVSIGLTPNKSKTLGPILVPDHLFFDFLRGHLDGDGSIVKYQDPIWQNSKRLYVRFTSASQRHINWLQKKILQISGMEGFIQSYSGMYRLSFSKHYSISLLDEIYPITPIPHLPRKFAIAQEFLMPR